MQKYIVEQLLSSLHARALLHAAIVEPIGSQPDFILFIFMTLKTPNIFSSQIYVFSYTFILSMVIKHVNTTNTHIRMKMNQFISVLLFVHLNNIPTAN